MSILRICCGQGRACTKDSETPRLPQSFRRGALCLPVSATKMTSFSARLDEIIELCRRIKARRKPLGKHLVHKLHKRGIVRSWYTIPLSKPNDFTVQKGSFI